MGKDLRGIPKKLDRHLVKRGLDRDAYLLGTSPSSSVAIVLNAATERSIEFALLQVGQSSATVTVTVLPLFWLVI